MSESRLLQLYWLVVSVTDPKAFDSPCDECIETLISASCVAEWQALCGAFERMTWQEHPNFSYSMQAGTWHVVGMLGSGHAVWVQAV